MSTTSSWWRTDAAAWSARGWTLEVRGDELADISFNERVLLRAVRAAVRDRGWQTVPVTVQSMSASDSTLVLTLRHEGLGAQIDSTLRVAATSEALTVSWDAENGDAFDTCRTGLVVLHPAEDAGREAVVEHQDGSSEQVAFPREISPHQPIMDIRSLRVDGAFSLEFAGDVFEMEDQRNWTDASFKTYSRPLGLPYPYVLDAGEHVRQSVTIRVLGDGTSAVLGAEALTLVEAGAFPAIGVEASTAPDPVPASTAGAFRVVELDLRTPNWRAALERAAADGVALDVRLVTDGDTAMLVEAARAIAHHANGAGARSGAAGAGWATAPARAVGAPGVLRVTAFDAVEHMSDEGVVEALRRALESVDLVVPVLAGARSHFTELNREQAQIAHDVDGITVNTTPLFHSLDTEQLVEAVAMQRLIAEQAVSIADGLPVHIGPVSLRPRFNNVATTPEPAPTKEDLSEGYGAQFTGAADDRQGARELGAWVIASAAALAVPGVASLSWFETWGPRGLASEAGRTPAAAAIDALASLAGGTLLSSASPDGLVWAVGSRTDAEDTVLVANLDRASRSVMIEGLGAISLDPGGWRSVTRPSAR